MKLSLIGDWYVALLGIVSRS